MADNVSDCRENMALKKVGKNIVIDFFDRLNLFNKQNVLRIGS
jgi:hypothetical protein